MTFLKQNWFKITIIIIIIAFVASFIVIEAKKRASEQAELDLQSSIKCQQIGYAEYLREKSEDGRKIFLSPLFKFDKTLNTCLYKGESLGGLFDNESFIKDVYTNRTLASWTRTKNDKGRLEDFLSNADEFHQKVVEYGF